MIMLKQLIVLFLTPAIINTNKEITKIVDTSMYSSLLYSKFIILILNNNTEENVDIKNKCVYL